MVFVDVMCQGLGLSACVSEKNEHKQGSDTTDQVLQEP